MLVYQPIQKNDFHVFTRDLSERVNVNLKHMIEDFDKQTTSTKKKSTVNLMRQLILANTEYYSSNQLYYKGKGGTTCSPDISSSEKIEEEYNLIPLFDQGVKAFNEFGFKWNLIGYQKKVELDIQGIPMIGYTDFHFEDKQTKEDFYIDLKTTKRKPSGLSMSHAMQQSIYQRATNANQKLWYLVAKKTGCDFYSMELNEYRKPMQLCEHIVSVMGNYLSKVNSKEDVRDSLIPNPDDWIWRDDAVYKARKEVWGY